METLNSTAEDARRALARRRQAYIEMARVGMMRAFKTFSDHTYEKDDPSIRDPATQNLVPILPDLH